MSIFRGLEARPKPVRGTVAMWVGDVHGHKVGEERARNEYPGPWDDLKWIFIMFPYLIYIPQHYWMLAMTLPIAPAKH